jgi:hypothetical protein
MGERMPEEESHLRDLARKLYNVATEHTAFSQVADFMGHVNRHLCALAFAEESARRQGDMVARIERLERTVGHLCPDKRDDL